MCFLYHPGSELLLPLPSQHIAIILTSSLPHSFHPSPAILTPFVSNPHLFFYSSEVASSFTKQSTCKFKFIWGYVLKIVFLSSLRPPQSSFTLSIISITLHPSPFPVSFTPNTITITLHPCHASFTVTPPCPLQLCLAS